MGECICLIKIKVARDQAELGAKCSSEVRALAAAAPNWSLLNNVVSRCKGEVLILD
jgi:hypothetical protein